MIDPIGSNLSALTSTSTLLAAERATQQSESATRVTRTEESQANGSSTSQSQSQSQTKMPGETQFGDQKTTLEKALELVNNNLQAWSTGMRFDVDEDAQRVVISIVDSSTGEVLRTVPSDAVLRVAKMIVQLQGSLVDTKV